MTAGRIIIDPDGGLRTIATGLTGEGVVDPGRDGSTAGAATCALSQFSDINAPDYADFGVPLSLGAPDYRLEEFRNDSGFIRQHCSRGLVDLRLSRDRGLVETAYSEWVLDDVYLALKHVMKRITVHTGMAEVSAEYCAVKCRKRGNDVDAHRLDRHKRVLRGAIEAFIPKGLRSTSALYVTGTVDPKRVDGNVERAWRELGSWFNSFLAGLRSKCITVELTVSEKTGKPRIRKVRAKISVLRSWESTEKGWPHWHAILCFEGYPWEIFLHENKETGRNTWRVRDKEKFEDSWTHGFVDVLALTRGTLEKNIDNVLWYVSKNLSAADYRLVRSWPHKRRLTQGLLWYLGLRSYSVSRSLLKGDAEPDPGDLTKRLCITQVGQLDLAGNLVIRELAKWDFVGLVRREDTELSRDDWAKTYADPPDWLACCWKPYSRRGGLGWSSSWLSGGA